MSQIQSGSDYSKMNKSGQMIEVERKTFNELKKQLQMFDLKHLNLQDIQLMSIDDINQVLAFIDDTKARLLNLLVEIEAEKQSHKNP